ncbi:BolA family transcriptional regulator [Acidiphilium sp. AL]|uniref:BolA family transcriptional regulator n=1 Tax=Acidiphilium iwatense TaxID=768198 RepID=A0ABS9DU07_9PROT|nr:MULTISPECIES: BolA family protein [Acidiphilium]MCF3946206.1 BolA family transcriptional regulator [Acidiphilium iwatense]MCU4158778.1 BolA family transcriptional regulator [Acidiphilium sp. AL]
MTSRTERIRNFLTTSFEPIVLDIEDDSARHAGHAGAAPGGETHYNVRLVSPRFAGMSRVVRSRAVHDALKTEFDAGLHALSLDLKAPGEG